VNEIVLSEEVFQSIRTLLLNSKRESCAILLAHHAKQQDSTRLLVVDYVVAPLDAYRKRNTSSAVLDPSFFAPIVKRAQRTQMGIIFVHTHPWDQSIPRFSSIDDRGEQLLKAFLDSRGLQSPNAALLFGAKFCRGRLLATNDSVRVVVVGQTRSVVFDPNESLRISGIYDRQVRLLGKYGQESISKIRVAIVGLGGTGSVVAQELAHLGVSDFTLIDPDCVDESNLNRLIGAEQVQIGLPKVDVVAGSIARINSRATVTTHMGNILFLRSAKLLLGADFIFCCTDSQASRATINQIAYQYYIPTIDIGVSIVTHGTNITRITGRSQLLSPGVACLTCQEVLNSTIIRFEFMTPEQRATDPYFIGGGETQPAVISLNSTMSSLAVTLFLAVVAGFPSRSRHLLYDAVQGRVRTAVASKNVSCVVCSKYGALGRADSWPLPVHDDVSPYANEK